MREPCQSLLEQQRNIGKVQKMHMYMVRHK